MTDTPPPLSEDERRRLDEPPVGNYDWELRHRALARLDWAEGELARLRGALQEIATDTDHPSWRKSKAIARAALEDTAPEEARND